MMERISKDEFIKTLTNKTSILFDSRFKHMVLDEALEYTVKNLNLVEMKHLENKRRRCVLGANHWCMKFSNGGILFFTRRSNNKFFRFTNINGVEFLVCAEIGGSLRYNTKWTRVVSYIIS